MANVKAPRGFINPRFKTGGEPRSRSLKVASGYSTADFLPGQLVKRVNDGTVAHVTAASTDLVLGVVMGYLQKPSAQNPANSDLNVDVVTDLMNTEWEIQLSHATGGQTLVGNIADPYTYTLTTADSLRRFAPNLLLGSNIGTSGVRMCKIIGFPTDPANEYASANPRVLVEFNPTRLDNMVTTGV